MNLKFIIIPLIFFSFLANAQTGEEGCFENFFQAGIVALDSLSFTKAEKQFTAADLCDNKPEDYHLKDWQDTIRARYFFTLESAERARKAEIKALQEKAKADSALNLANRIIDAFYFYNGKYALAFKKIDENYGKYGFINREGITLIRYLYDEATPFDNYTGFAKVKRNNQKYLIDTLGNEYILAEEIEQLNDLTEALDLSDKNLNTIPDEVFLHPRLKILFVYQNHLTELPQDFEKLVHLQILDVSGNAINSLPENINRLEHLDFLDLSANKFQQLPAIIGNLKELNILKLSNNLLTQVPDFLQQMDSLEYIELTGNNIDPNIIEQAKQLMPDKIIAFKTLGLALNESRSNQPETSAEDLTDDKLFFEDKKEKYQAWLNSKGLGQILKVHELLVDSNQLSLYLSFPFENPDSVVAAWRGLKEKFELSQALSLEQQLFYKMTFLMEISPEQGNIQLYDTYDLTKEPIFFRGIYFADRQVKVETSNPRSSISDIAISGLEESEPSSSYQDYSVNYPKNAVFSLILEYIENRFKETSCFIKSPEIRILETGDLLRFEVSNLCQEVLPDVSPRPRVEILNFTISYQATSSGFKLYTLIDGKYSTRSISRLRRGDFKSMEIDFLEQLRNYSSSFNTELYKWLDEKIRSQRPR